MSKGKKKTEIPENETGEQTFRRVVTTRCKNLAKAYNLIIRMPKQPSYDVSQKDAEKLIAWVEEFHTEFLNRFDPIAKGLKISRAKEQELKPIF